MSDRALVTGFVPYGGRGRNPAAEIAAALDGRTILGMPVIGRTLPVSYSEIRRSVEELLNELRPRVVISLGLWPGATMIRIERVGLNLADFEIPDNTGWLATDELIVGNGATALIASLPTRKIERSLLDAGIPARISNSAGTFLCNACLYSFLSAVEARAQNTACGFIHVPYLPEQVAGLLTDLAIEARQEVHQRADLASMDLATSTRAVEVALQTTIAELGRR
jgi:pyroglutamyl-peptidase